MSKITIADGYDWMGIYVDDKLIAEDHSFNLITGLEICHQYKVDDFEVKSIDEDWLMNAQTYPNNISEVKWK